MRIEGAWWAVSEEVGRELVEGQAIQSAFTQSPAPAIRFSSHPKPLVMQTEEYLLLPIAHPPTDSPETLELSSRSSPSSCEEEAEGSALLSGTLSSRGTFETPDAEADGL